MIRSIIRFTLLLLLAAAAIRTDPVPKGVLHARVEGPPEQSLPWALDVRVRPSLQLVGQENLGWENMASCPVRDGELTCPITAGFVDLRITGTAIQPIYRWGVQVNPKETVDLGLLQLRRGGSISGSVRPDGKIPQYSVRVEILSMGATPQSLQTAVLESTTRPWGFFRFEGLPAGQYIVQVTDPGLPVVRSSLVVFEGDRAVELPPIDLKRIAFSLAISPSRDRSGNPWQVAFMRQPRPNLFPQKHEYQKADSGGRASFDALTPGDYTLIVGAADGQRWLRKEVHLEKSTHLGVTIPYARIKGSVLYQGKDLGRMRVTLQDSSLSFGFSFLTDEKGRFDGYINDANPWSVVVSKDKAPSGVILQDPIAVPEAGASKLEIRIPDTLLTAEVVDARGLLATRASVQVLGDARHILKQEERPVQFIGLNPGLQRVRIVQEEPCWEDDPVEIELREGKKDSHLRLRLRLPKTIDIQGRVLPRFGWPADVRIFAWPVGRSEGVGVKADPEGKFRFLFPEDTHMAQFVVLPPGSALRILQPAVSEHKLLEIPVRRPGGTLIVEGPDALVEVVEPEEGAALKRSLPVLLRQWADIQGTPQSPGRLVVPNVEPGTYTLCPGSPFTLRSGEAKEGENGCADGVLKAAGELTLRIPAPSTGLPLPAVRQDHRR